MNVNKENLIEGIGDEVLIVISLLLITFIVFLIWLSKDLNCFPGYFRRILNSSSPEDSNNEIETNNDSNEEIIDIENDENLNFKENDLINLIQTKEEVAGDNQNNSTPIIEVCPDGFISIKLKYLDDRTYIVFADPQSTVLDFKRNNFQEELNSNKTIRLIYNGRELKELNGEATLAGYGLVHNSTVHCLVTVKREIPNMNSSTSENSIMSSEINIGSLMFPLFGFILSMIWYYRLNYKNHFNMISTFALIGITGMYFVTCFISYSTPVHSVRDPVRETVDSPNQ